MKKIFFFILLIFVSSCVNLNQTYWCGDHACINKKEKEAYFKKTMVVEIRNLNKSEVKKNKKTDQKVELNQKKKFKDDVILKKQAEINENIRIKKEKDLIKQSKIEEKIRIKNEKDLAKKMKIDEKRRIKEEKNLASQLELEEKERKKDKKVYSKKINENKKLVKRKNNVNESDNSKLYLSKFENLIEQITTRDSFRPYPDINDIPN